MKRSSVKKEHQNPFHFPCFAIHSLASFCAFEISAAVIRLSAIVLSSLAGSRPFAIAMLNHIWACT